MQLIGNYFGGEVLEAKTQEYGSANLYIDNNFDLLEGYG